VEGKAMQILGNLVFGAILAGVSLGPVAWADACALVDKPLAAAMASGLHVPTSPLDSAAALARLPHLVP
jgi:hypothetical protein